MNLCFSVCKICWFYSGKSLFKLKLPLSRAYFLKEYKLTDRNWSISEELYAHNSLCLLREQLNINFRKCLSPKETWFFPHTTVWQVTWGEELLDISLLSFGECDIRSNFISSTIEKKTRFFVFFPALHSLFWSKRRVSFLYCLAYRIGHLMTWTINHRIKRSFHLANQRKWKQWILYCILAAENWM